MFQSLPVLDFFKEDFQNLINRLESGKVDHKELVNLFIELHNMPDPIRKHVYFFGYRQRYEALKNASEDSEAFIFAKNHLVNGFKMLINIL